MHFDYYSDADKTVLEKMASVSPRASVDDLPDRDFAVIALGKAREHRQFPIVDEDATKLSMVYFLKNASEMPQAMRQVAGARIKEACVRFNLDIPKQLQGYPEGINGSHRVPYEFDAPSEQTKTASMNDLDDSMFGLVVERGDEKVRKFPLHDAAHVYRAADNFHKVAHSRALSGAQKAEVRQKIASRAKELGIDVGMKAHSGQVNPYMEKDAAFRTRHLDGDARKVYQNLASMVKLGRVSPYEAVEAVRALDKEHGMDDYRRRMSPEDLVFGSNEKLAASAGEFLEGWFEKTAKLSGDRLEEILHSQMRGELVQKLNEQFGPDIAKGLEQNPRVVYDSLPQPHQDVVDDIISGLGG